MSETPKATVACPRCKKKYRIRPEQRGKKLRCKACEAVFRIGTGGKKQTPPQTAPPADQPLSDDFLFDGLDQGETIATERPAAPPPPPGMDMAGDMQLMGAAVPTPHRMREEAVKHPEMYKGYLRDVARTFILLGNIGNIVTIMIWVVLLTVSPLLCFAGIIVSGLWWAFQFNVVGEAAAGEDEMPSIELTDWMNGIIMPLIRVALAGLLSILPAAILAGVLMATGQLDEIALAGNSLPELLVRLFQGDAAAAWVGLLLFLSYAMWPMLMLVVAIGDIGGLIRFDLMIATIVRTPLAYLMVVAFTYVFVAGPDILVGALSPADPDTVALGETAATLGIAHIAEVVAAIFAMRAIGLYYHHFKDHFAWSWG